MDQKQHKMSLECLRTFLDLPAQQPKPTNLLKIIIFCVFHPIWMKFGMGADMICEMATANT